MSMTAIGVFTAAAVAALLYGEYRDHAPLKWIAKPAASLGFIAFALAAGAFETDYGLLVFVGLVLCALGDVFLIPKSKVFFLAGMAAFALGHGGYIAAFVAAWGGFSTSFIAAAIIVAIVFPLIFRWLQPHLGEFRLPVAGYCVIIGVMTAMSFAAAPHGTAPYWPAAVGAVGFALSDIAVARNQFVRPSFFTRAWGLPLYYAAQMLLASSVSP